MTHYVAFLRGVNVGNINIKMADLRQLFSDLGFDGVRTILASGNVVFESGRTGRAALKKDIEKGLNDTFGYEAWIVLTDVATVRKIVDAYPFDPEHEGWHPYVVLGSDRAVLDQLYEIEPELDSEVEQLAKGRDVLYWEVERGQTLKSTFGKRTAAKRYKASTTTRNLRTLLKIIA